MKNRKIFKYTISAPREPFKLMLHPSAVFLHADVQPDSPKMWFETPEVPEHELSPRWYVLLGTGWGIPDYAQFHLATFQAGSFVWHLYECEAP